MKILIIGASGLLGHRIAQLALTKDYEVYSTYNENPTNQGIPIKLDLCARENQIEDLIHRLKPEVTIHTAAYTNVDGCEIKRDLAWKINAEATRHVAMAIAKEDSHLIYVSTDYVFDGEKGLYSEEDLPNPISYYGYTKLKGEEFVCQSNKRWCIVRPSVIYGWGPTHKKNFATWVMTNINRGQEVRVVTNQYVSPTFNSSFAMIILEIAERRITGFLHAAGSTRINRHDFALRLAEVFDLDTRLIKPAKMDELAWKADRPKDSSLNVEKALALLNQKPLQLDQSLRRMKQEGEGQHFNWNSDL